MNERGYTLVELILYVVVVSALLTGVTSFFGLAVDSRIKNQSMNEVNQQGDAVMDQIAGTIRGASTITSPAPGATASALTVTVPTGANSPTVYDVASGVLEIKEGTAAYVPLTNSKVQVTALTFKNVSRSGTDGAIQVNMTLARINNSGRNEYDYQKTFTTTVALR